MKATELVEPACARESRRWSGSARTRMKTLEGGNACTQMNALKWVYAARAREGVCACGITLNVAQVTESKSQLASWNGFRPEGPCALK